MVTVIITTAITQKRELMIFYGIYKTLQGMVEIFIGR